MSNTAGELEGSDPTDDSTEPDGRVRTAGFDAPHESVRDYLNSRLTAMRSGELGSVPIIIGLIGIVIVFGQLNDNFLTARNFTNLLLQMAPISFLAIGIVFILLIADGEVVTIDLSVAYVAAVGGTTLVLLQRPGDPGWPWWACILAAVGVTTAIGLLHSLIITRLGIPSFITTLAGFLIWSGVVLVLTTQFSTAGTIRLQQGFLTDISNNFLSEPVGWALGIAGATAYAATQVLAMRSRQARGLDAKPVSVVAIQIVLMAAVILVAVGIANSDRGVPQVTITLAVFLAFWTFVASKTAFGRHVYAVGGNDEATRRAGINVDNIRIAVFMVNGFMAGVGGIVLVSRLRSVATNTGGGNLLLNIIAAAVIGGTSLFGGQGRVISALYGALVITAIQNGMDLLGMASGTKFIVTGIVLLLAVLIDSVSKRRRAARGLA
jgi:D-xylose transport system permease protein